MAIAVAAQCDKGGFGQNKEDLQLGKTKGWQIQCKQRIEEENLMVGGGRRWCRTPKERSMLALGGSEREERSSRGERVGVVKQPLGIY